ncbi:DMT family transporter [Streptomyces sp. NPDC059740]|uniref:DMT family transporter n=1 Tax=Streptomyces sp. NPDC059740 TaxID=3346926 RepID=UPI00364EE469
MNAAAVVLALFGALSNGAASVLQRRAVMERPGRPAPAGPDEGGTAATRFRRRVRETLRDARRLARLLRSPHWLLGGAALAASAGFQAAALAFGRLSLVQPLLASELLFTLVVGSLVFHHRPDGRTWASFLMLAAGLALFLGAAAPSGGDAETASGRRWLAAGVCALLLVVVLVLAARAFGGPAAATLLGAATAVAFACTAALVKEVTQLVPQGLAEVFGTWHLYAACAAGLLSMVLLQSALAAGTLAASQPALTLVDAMVSVALGYVLFGERISLGLRVLPEVAGLLLIALGAVGLSRSPAVAGGGWDTGPAVGAAGEDPSGAGRRPAADGGAHRADDPGGTEGRG